MPECDSARVSFKSFVFLFGQLNIFYEFTNERELTKQTKKKALKLFTVVIYECSARVLVPVVLFQPSLKFANKARSLT